MTTPERATRSIELKLGRSTIIHRQMKYQHRVLGMLSLLSIITYIDRVCIAVAGPRIQESLHISPERGAG